VTFTTFNAVISYYFISTEIKSSIKIFEQKQNTETLLRIVLHDIANQMTTLDYSGKKMISFIPDISNNEKANKTADRFIRAAKEVTSIITQIRQMNATSDGKVELALDRVDLRKALEEVIELQNMYAENKLITINSVFPKEDLIIKSDATILKNVVLTNILTNAIKFSNEKSKIDIRLSQKENEIQLEVQDYGIGIPKEMITDLFAFNKKTSRKGTNGEVGTGYGMPLVKKYVEMMNGHISIQSVTEATAPQTTGTIMQLSFPKVLK
jgi:signal transduction histidine kinase